MQSPVKSWRAVILVSLVVAAALYGTVGPSTVAGPLGGGPRALAAWPGSILVTLRPDYRRYIGEVRPVAYDDAPPSGGRGIYMALVRPGAGDPSRPESAPFAGPGVRNDVLYDTAAFREGRSAGWVLLLLDHEYFHARHLAGATSLPLPQGVSAEIERHFYEGAAWGFSVSEARAGRYPGLREDEFREALDRYGDHYAALRTATRPSEQGVRRLYSDLLLLPPRLLTTDGSRTSADPGRPSVLGPSPGTP